MHAGVSVGEKIPHPHQPPRLCKAAACRLRNQFPSRPETLPNGKIHPNVGHIGTPPNLGSNLGHHHIRVAPQLSHLTRKLKQLRGREPRHVDPLARTHGQRGRTQRAGAEVHNTHPITTH
jgi:hypothetical protein